MSPEIAQEFQKVADFIGMNEMSSEKRNQERKHDSDIGISENSDGVLDIANLSDENSTAIIDIAEILDDITTRLEELEDKING